MSKFLAISELIAILKHTFYFLLNGFLRKLDPAKATKLLK